MLNFVGALTRASAACTTSLVASCTCRSKRIHLQCSPYIFDANREMGFGGNPIPGTGFVVTPPMAKAVLVISGLTRALTSIVDSVIESVSQ
jgi:hypothetical protein